MRRKKQKIIAVCFIVVIALCLWAGQAGPIRIRVNLSPSVPTGIWRMDINTSEWSGDVRFGYVVVTPSAHPGYRLAVERGYLHDLMPMLKRIVATEGDFVSYDERERAITVNGSYIPMTEILSRDTEGRDLPRPLFPTRLKRGEAWLSSENIRGYDSRYFGPVSTDLLQRAEPVWIFGRE
jgi:conjugative transfer signal peptidase TraF